MRSVSRRLVLLTMIGMLTCVVGSDARAADELPSDLLARLIHRVVAFDRNSAARALARPRAIVVQKTGDDGSIRSARLIAHDLAESDDSGRSLSVEIVTYAGPGELVIAMRERQVSLVVLVNGLEAEMPAIASAFAGNDVLTIGTTGVLADRGAVVGFELRAGKPKLVVNLTSARAQNVLFRAELLVLARIVQ